MKASIGDLRRVISELLDGYGSKAIGAGGIEGNLRYDVATTGHRFKGVLDDLVDDEDVAKQAFPQAACCLITRADGKVLVVSRRDDPSMLGLPGGKVDPGEEPIDAAARELEEETGLTALSLNPVFSKRDAHGYTTTTFATKVKDHDVYTEEEGVVSWVDPEVLLDPSSSPFTDYNKALFRRLRGG